MSTDITVDDRYLPDACGELDEVAAVLADGRLSGGASIVDLYEHSLSGWFGSRHVVAVNSGTSALHATLTALGVGPGTEVLIPATAVLPTAMPILTCGATPVIVDTLPMSLGLDPDDVARKLTVRTKAALTLPLWGYPADNTAAAALLAAANVPIVEDACQAHGAKLSGRYVGTHGRAGCFSTHDRKLLSTGEGGFVLTDDPELAARIDHYTHLGHLKGGHGVNYKLAGPLAAIGLRRLRGLAAQLRIRRVNAAQILAALPADGIFAELDYPPGSIPNYYNLVLTVDPGADRARVAADLAAAGLPPDSVRYRYRPLHRQALFARYARSCPNADELCATTVQVPVHPGMPAATIEWVTDRIRGLASPAAAEKEPHRLV